MIEQPRTGAPAPEPHGLAAEPAGAPARPVAVAETPRRRWFIDRRPSNGPLAVGLLLTGALVGGFIFRDDLGRATGLGRDGSNSATPTANSAAAGDGEKAKIEAAVAEALKKRDLADAEKAKAAKEQADATAAPATAAATAKALSREELQKAGNEAHTKRLVELDPEFRQKGTFAWLVKAGFSFKGLSVKQEARQVEEETLTVDGNTRILASGVQVDVTDLDAPWPNALTTSDPSVVGKARVCVQPDPSNPSRLCTDVKGFNGKATLYVDAQNWAQLAPKK